MLADLHDRGAGTDSYGVYSRLGFRERDKSRKRLEEGILIHISMVLPSLLCVLEPRTIRTQGSLLQGTSYLSNVGCFHFRIDITCHTAQSYPGHRDLPLTVAAPLHGSSSSPRTSNFRLITLRHSRLKAAIFPICPISASKEVPSRSASTHHFLGDWADLNAAQLLNRLQGSQPEYPDRDISSPLAVARYVATL
ncbi:hypothetical protein LX32DRAFT_309237 [Colletotrichum zoysiae]|uniref:Uncharacterized protein n=1 Tax=Colletotrichum zoysiae TaxID=1216348 RepID=A0AAD9M7K3_9PEZI|nr:hypothetical protein LX32DRAFT_309237 [Colletotrichum zoysiae]